LKSFAFGDGLEGAQFTAGMPANSDGVSGFDERDMIDRQRGVVVARRTATRLEARPAAASSLERNSISNRPAGS